VNVEPSTDQYNIRKKYVKALATINDNVKETRARVAR